MEFATGTLYHESITSCILRSDFLLKGNLDDNGKLVLARRLVREGLLVVLAV